MRLPSLLPILVAAVVGGGNIQARPLTHPFVLAMHFQKVSLLVVPLPSDLPANSKLVPIVEDLLGLEACSTMCSITPLSDSSDSAVAEFVVAARPLTEC